MKFIAFMSLAVVLLNKDLCLSLCFLFLSFRGGD